MTQAMEVSIKQSQHKCNINYDCLTTEFPVELCLFDTGVQKYNCKHWLCSHSTQNDELTVDTPSAECL